MLLLGSSVASLAVCVLAFRPHHPLVACCDTADDCVDPTIMILLRFRVVVLCVLNFGHSSQSLYPHSGSCWVKYGPFSVSPESTKMSQKDMLRMNCAVLHWALFLAALVETIKINRL